MYIYTYLDIYIKIGWAKILTSSNSGGDEDGEVEERQGSESHEHIGNTNECGKTTKLEVSVLESSNFFIKIFKTYVCFTELRFVDVRV